MQQIDLTLRLALVALMALAGWQDWRKREVSNLITIPLFFAGALFNFARFPSESFWLILFVFAVLTAAVALGWMGGADWKTQIGLLGLWPLAGVAAFAASGCVGAVIWLITRRANVRFPAVSVMAVAVALTFIGEALTMQLSL